MNNKLHLRLVTWGSVFWMVLTAVIPNISQAAKPLVNSVQGCQNIAGDNCKSNVLTQGQYAIIKGSGFTINRTGTPGVFIETGSIAGGIKLELVGSTNTQLTARVPSSVPLGARDGIVSVDDEDSSSFNVTVVAAQATSGKPSISGIKGCNDKGCVDDAVLPGDTLAIEGENFVTPASGNKVFIGGTAYIPRDGSTTAINVDLPKTLPAKTYNMTVLNINGSSTPFNFTVYEGGGSGEDPGNEQQLCPQAFTNNPPLLKEKSTNSGCVRLVQLKLGLTPDGIFDSTLTKEVKDLQSGNGITGKCLDGQVGPQTWSLLLVRNYPGINTECYKGGPPAPGGDGTGNDGSGGSTSGGDCGGEPELEMVNGLCLPKGRPTGSGLVSCDSVGSCLSKIIKILLTLAGIIAVLFIIIGGFQYMTSAGNEGRAESGKKTLINALIGLGAILLAYTIVTIINNTLTKDSIL